MTDLTCGCTELNFGGENKCNNLATQEDLLCDECRSIPVGYVHAGAAHKDQGHLTFGPVNVTLSGLVQVNDSGGTMQS